MFGSNRLLRRPETLTATATCRVRGDVTDVWEALVDPRSGLSGDVVETGWMPGSPRGVGGRQYYVTEDGTTQVSVLEVVEFVPPHRARVVDVSAWCQSWYEVTVDDTGDGHCSVTHEYWIVLPAGVPETWIRSHQQALTHGVQKLAARLPRTIEAIISAAGG